MESVPDHLPPTQGLHFAILTLACVGREFPRNPAHVIADATEVHRPREFHCLADSVRAYPPTQSSEGNHD